MESNLTRSALIERIVGAAFETAHGRQAMDEQNLMRTLGELVKTKLLSAEDSFILREKLLDINKFDHYIESRVQTILRRRGLMAN